MILNSDNLTIYKHYIWHYANTYYDLTYYGFTYNAGTYNSK